MLAILDFFLLVIAGLGNLGVQYDGTPHNVGFETIDKLASDIAAIWEFKKAYNADIARGTFAGKQVLLVKPKTYMNLSGDAIAPLVKYSNSSAADLLVIHDDIDLPVGKLRIKKGGSAGGHNGLKSIIERLGTQDFKRLKIGVGKDKSNVVKHVLGKFDPATRETMDKVTTEAVKAAAVILKDGPDKAMNVYNGWNA